MKAVIIFGLPFVALGYAVGCIYYGIIAGFRGARHDVRKAFNEE